MTNWQIFWIVFALLASGPSMHGIAEGLQAIAAAIRYHANTMREIRKT